MAQHQSTCRELDGDRHPLTESLWSAPPARMVQACLITWAGGLLGWMEGTVGIVEKARVSHWIFSFSDAHDPLSLTHFFLLPNSQPALGTTFPPLTFFPLRRTARCLLVLCAAPGRALTQQSHSLSCTQSALSNNRHCTKRLPSPIVRIPARLASLVPPAYFTRGL